MGKRTDNKRWPSPEAWADAAPHLAAMVRRLREQKSSDASAPASDAPRTVVGPRGEIEEAS